MGIAFAIIFLAGICLVTVGVLSLVGKLRPNHFAGIRTPYTLQSDANWYAAQRAGSPWLIFGGIAGTAAALACLPFAFAGKLSGGGGVAVCIVLALILLLSAAASWTLGPRGARRGFLSTGPTGFPESGGRRY